MATLDVEPTELAAYAQAKASGRRAQTLCPSSKLWPLGLWSHECARLQVPAPRGQTVTVPTSRGESHLFSKEAVLPSPGCHRNGLQQEVGSGLRLLSLGEMH